MFKSAMNITKLKKQKSAQFYPSHGEKYYALFFKDLDGIKLEVMFEEKGF